MLKMKNLVAGTVLVSAMLGAFSTAAFADEIALTFANHDLVIVGEFTAYQDDAYLIMTENGEIHVPAILVTCEGEKCVAPRNAPLVNG